MPDPLEHLGLGVTDGVKPGVVPRWTEMSVCLQRDAGWHATIESSGTVPTVPSGSATWVDPGGQTALPGEGGPKLGPDVREDNLVLGAAVPTLSPVEVRVRDILDQYETFNGMPVYYGGDRYDSEDSDWDDPYAIASAAYVEDYYFDVPEGMDLMVHRHHRDLDNSDIHKNWKTPVCQTMSCVTRDEWDTIDDDSLTEAFVADGQNMDEFYRRVVSSDEEANVARFTHVRRIALSNRRRNTAPWRVVIL